MTQVRRPEIDSLLPSHVSPERKMAFLERFIADRQQTATTEMLFKRANAFKEEADRPPPQELSWTGFNVLLRKEPFLDLPNWGPYRSWDFAVAMELHLLARLDQELRDSTKGRLGDPVNREVTSVVNAFDVMANELEESGYKPSLFVLAGQLGTKLAVNLKKLLITHPFASETIGSAFRLQGTYLAIPVLHIPESPSPAIYAVDLHGFARLTRYGNKPIFELVEFSAEQAEDLLARNSGLISDPPPGPNTKETRARQLQMRVGLRLYETYKLNVLNRQAVAGSSLIGPVLEYEPDS